MTDSTFGFRHSGTRTAENVIRIRVSGPISGLLTLMILLCLNGCPSGTPLTSDLDIETVSLEQLQELLLKNQSKNRVVLVDVRSPQRFASGHLPHAINIPLAELKANDPRLMGKNKSIVVYSEGWYDPLSQAAWKKLVYQGYKQVLDYRGGVTVWRNEEGVLVESQ